MEKDTTSITTPDALSERVDNLRVDYCECTDGATDAAASSCSHLPPVSCEGNSVIHASTRTFDAGVHASTRDESNGSAVVISSRGVSDASSSGRLSPAHGARATHSLGVSSETSEECGDESTLDGAVENDDERDRPAEPADDHEPGDPTEPEMVRCLATCASGGVWGETCLRGSGFSSRPVDALRYSLDLAVSELVTSSTSIPRRPPRTSSSASGVSSINDLVRALRGSRSHRWGSTTNGSVVGIDGTYIAGNTLAVAVLVSSSGFSCSCSCPETHGEARCAAYVNGWMSPG